MRTRMSPKTCVRQYVRPVSPGCSTGSTCDQSVGPKAIPAILMAESSACALACPPRQGRGPALTINGTSAKRLDSTTTSQTVALYCSMDQYSECRLLTGGSVAT